MTLTAAMAGQSPAAPLAEPATPCIAVATLVSPAMFRRYPADAIWKGPGLAPDVGHGNAHLFRTAIRAEAVGPPNFAGRYKLGTHGCGAGSACPFVVDLETGRVRFEPALTSIETLYDVADIAGIHDLRLVSRADSRLLVAVGTRNEDLRLAGASLFEWRDDRLRLIRFVPHSLLCHDRPGLEGAR